MIDQLTGSGLQTMVPLITLLVDAAIKGVILIGAAAFIAYLLRNKAASARHAAWTAAVVGHLALPSVTMLVPEWRIPVLPAPAWLAVPAAGDIQAPQATAVDVPVMANHPVGEQAVPPAEAATPGRASTPGAATGSIVEPAASAGPRWPATSVFAALWIVGSMLILLRLALGTRKVGRLARNGERVDDGEWLSLTQRLANRLGITRPLTLLRGDSLAVPVTWGVVYPAVLLPPESNEWPEERRRFVLVHEMAHVKRFDALTQLLAQITIAVFWFDPFIWIAAHRMRVEREHACDDYVLRDGTRPSLYAEELLEMVRSIGAPRHESAVPAFAALAMARRSEFEGRMLAILDNRQDRHPLGRRHALVATLALVILVLPLAALRPFGRAETAAVTKTASEKAVAAAVKPSSKDPGITEIACDSVMSIPVDRSKGETRWTHVNVVEDDKTKQRTELEFLSYRPGRCVQAIIEGPASFANDQLAALPEGSRAYFRELNSSDNRTVRIQPVSGGRVAYTALEDGRASSFDAETQRWLNRVLSETLKETGIEARPRVSRWLSLGGVSSALVEIGRINSTSSKRKHYEALLSLRQLNENEASSLRSHAIRNLAGSASDLEAVLKRVESGAATAATQTTPGTSRSVASVRNELNETTTSTDSATVLSRAAATQDPAMVLMTLQGAKELSSDTDRRVLLQLVVAPALSRKDPAMRKAFFDAANAMDSDTDLRATLVAAIPYGQADPEVTLAVFRLVAAKMTSDTDKRTTLMAAVEQKLLKTAALREAFMAAARTIDSSTDFTVLMQAALKQ